jgi:hypothetical protein
MKQIDGRALSITALEERRRTIIRMKEQDRKEQGKDRSLVSSVV